MMSRLFEAMVAMIAALGIHLSVLFLMPEPEKIARSSGAASADTVSVLPADPAIQALIAAWQQPPAAQSDAPAAPLAPQAGPTAPLSDIGAETPQLPSASALPIMPEADVAPVLPEQAEPPPAPKTPKAKPATRPSVPAKKPSSSGGGASGGALGKAAPDTGADPGAKTQIAKWGAAIRARIERRKAYPVAANGKKGRVVLNLRVATDGRLVSVAIATSSGNAALDSAALSAVRSAGRFPKSPNGISGETGFMLPMSFNP